MSDPPHDNDGKRPEESNPEQDENTPGEPQAPPASDDEKGGFELELEPDWDQRQPAQRSVRALDVCPNCGGEMRGTNKMLCMRCGFNLKTLKVVEIETGEVEVSEEDGTEGEEEPKPLVRPGCGQYRLPLILAAVAGAILIVGYLAGASALFHQGEGETLTIGGRFAAVAQFVGLMALWTIGGVAALASVASINARPFGSIKLAAARMLGIMVSIRLATFISFGAGWGAWERTAEALVQIVAYALLVWLLFGLPRRDVTITVGTTVLMIVGLYFVAWLIKSVGLI